MKALIQHKFVALFAAALSLAAVSAHADSFKLDYTFGGGYYSGGAGTSIDLTFNGTLNGNLISGISNATLTVNGVSQGSVYGYAFNGSDWFNGTAVISLNGAQNNFLFANTNNPTLGSYNFIADSLTGSAAAYNANYSYMEFYKVSPSFAAYDENNQGSGSSLNSTYKITDLTTSSSVPDSGATITMLGLAVAGLIGLRRKRR